MEYRTAKQLVYGAIYLAIFLWIAFWFYFLLVRPAPSCFDKKQNQNEEGIDCGGVCAQFCLPENLGPVSVVDEVSVFYPTPQKATILTRIKNPNASHGALVSYLVTLYDSQNQPFMSVPQEAVLYPSQVRYVIVPSVDLAEISSSIARVELYFQKVDWRPAEFFSQPQVAVRDQEVFREGNFVQIKGNITNDDLVDVPEATAVAVFFNQFRIPIGAAKTDLSQLVSGETREFTIVHPMLPGLTFERTQVFVMTD